MTRQPIRVAAAAILCLVLPACMSVRVAPPAIDLHGRPISSLEIQQEMRGDHQTAWGVLFGLTGATAGFFAGAKIGYELDRLDPCYCEDPGLNGLLLGSLIGSVVGVTAGAVWGSRIGFDYDRLDAIQRIMQRRIAERRDTTAALWPLRGAFDRGAQVLRQ